MSQWMPSNSGKGQSDNTEHDQDSPERRSLFIEGLHGKQTMIDAYVSKGREMSSLDQNGRRSFGGISMLDWVYFNRESLHVHRRTAFLWHLMIALPPARWLNASIRVIDHQSFAFDQHWINASNLLLCLLSLSLSISVVIFVTFELDLSYRNQKSRMRLSQFIVTHRGHHKNDRSELNPFQLMMGECSQGRRFIICFTRDINHDRSWSTPVYYHNIDWWMKRNTSVSLLRPCKWEIKKNSTEGREQTKFRKIKPYV